MCTNCLDLFVPVKINGVSVLKEFNGYTVDLRLQQFRKAKIGEELEFIDFDSEAGQELLRQMHVA